MLGSYLVAHLLKMGYQSIVCVVRDINRCGLIDRVGEIYGIDQASTKIELIEGDCSDYNFMMGVVSKGDIVYCLAAKVGFDPNDTSIIPDNVAIATTAAQVCSHKSVQVVVYASSIATLQPSECVSEKSIPTSIKGKSLYSQSKFYAEGEFWRAHYGGAPVIIVNPSIILGVGDWAGRGSCSLIRRFSKGSKFVTSGATGFVGASDVVAIMEQLSHCNQAIGQRYIINSQNIEFKSLVETISTKFGNKTSSYIIPDWVIRTFLKMALIAERFKIKVPISSESLRQLTRKVNYDNSKITELLGYKFSTIDKVIDQCVEQYKKDTE